MKSSNGTLGVTRSDRCEGALACPQARPATARRHVSPILTLPVRSHFGSGCFLFRPFWQFGHMFVLPPNCRPPALYSDIFVSCFAGLLCHFGQQLSLGTDTYNGRVNAFTTPGRTAGSWYKERGASQNRQNWPNYATKAESGITGNNP